jgi:hypothetical protein
MQSTRSVLTTRDTHSQLPFNRFRVTFFATATLKSLAYSLTFW